MKLNRSIAISDSGFIFNPTTGDSFSTNPVGAEIIRLLKEGKNKTEIVESVCQKYMVDMATFEKDLGDFLMVLSSYQLIKDKDYE